MVQPATKLVILDRDGTINEDRDDYVKSVDEWVPIPGAVEAIARLNQHGWRVVIATNQSGLGRGLFDMDALNRMHQRLNELLIEEGGRVDAIFFCPHAPEDHCRCRKPLPGLFEQIADRYGITLAGSVHAVGDSLRDLQAAVAVGCLPHLVLTGKAARLDEADQQRLREQIPGVTFHADLAAFADALIASETSDRPRSA
jgi:D-glycero-D-manno-heptose 1,7-bisphosphate phosphatase